MNTRDIIITSCIVVILLAIFGFYTFKMINEKFEAVFEEIELLKGILNIQKKNKIEKFTDKKNELNNKYNVNSTEKVIPQVSNSSSNINLSQSGVCNRNDTSGACDNSSIENVEKEVAELEKELGNLNELIDDSDTYSNSSNIKNQISIDDIINPDELIEYQRNLQDSNELGEVNSNIINMVEKLDNNEIEVEYSDISEARQYKKNNSSEFDELAYIETDRNSELNELINDETNNLEKLSEDNLDNTSDVNSQHNSDVNSEDNSDNDSELNSKELSSSSESNQDNVSEYNIEETTNIKAHIEYEVLAKEFLQKNLKDICKNNNLSMKGNKVQLLERLFDAGLSEHVLSKK